MVKLSERELDVLRLLARGWLTSQIQAKLGISNLQVRTHISNMLKKLGLWNQVQLVVWAHCRGVVALWEIDYGQTERHGEGDSPGPGEKAAGGDL